MFIVGKKKCLLNFVLMNYPGEENTNSILETLLTLSVSFSDDDVLSRQSWFIVIVFFIRDMFISVMSHIGWGGEQITLYKGVETFP